MPMLTTFMILVKDEDVKNAVFKDGIIKNRKTLESIIETNVNK